MTEALPIKKLKLPRKGRAIDGTYVRELMVSIRDVGLLHPIVVGPGMRVIAGVHRMKACQELGWTEIPATTVRHDGLQAELAQIDENLIRNPGTALERSEALHRRQEIYEELNPATKHGGDRRSIKRQKLPLDRPKSFAADTAAKTKIAERTVRDHVQVAKNLDRKARDVIAKTPSADKLADLQALVKLPAEQQREVAAKVAETGQGVKEVLRSDGEPNERFTPRALIADLHRFNQFTVDAASNPKSPAARVIGRFWTKEDDGLEESWRGERVFVNPPFDACEEWVEKASREFAAGCELIVMLLPAVRTEQSFWQDWIEPFRDQPGSPIRTKFLRGRTSFGYPNDPEGEHSGSPEFGCVLVTWDARRIESKHQSAAGEPTPPTESSSAADASPGSSEAGVSQAKPAINWKPGKGGNIDGKTRGHSHRWHRLFRVKGGYTRGCSDHGSTSVKTEEAAKAECEAHEISKYRALAPPEPPKKKPGTCIVDKCRNVAAFGALCAKHNSGVVPDPGDDRCCASECDSKRAHIYLPYCELHCPCDEHSELRAKQTAEPKRPPWIFEWRRGENKPGTNAHAFGAPLSNGRARCGASIAAENKSRVVAAAWDHPFCRNCRTGVDADVRELGAIDPFHEGTNAFNATKEEYRQRAEGAMAVAQAVGVEPAPACETPKKHGQPGHVCRMRIHFEDGQVGT